MKRRIFTVVTKRNVILGVLVTALVVVFWSRSPSQEWMDHDLTHLRRSRKLFSYVEDIETILVGPTMPPCQERDIPLIALVTSAPAHWEQRLAIRATWGTTQPTYFFLGVSRDDHQQQLKQNYIEAAQYDDMVITKLVDSYDNLTLKTAALMSWALKFCPHAHFVMKVDDDVLVNPWTLEDVLRDHHNASLLGLRYDGHPAIRDPRDKWYLPAWLFPDDIIPEFLGGPAYFIRGRVLPELYKRAFLVPLINIEDVFYSYLVGKRGAGLELSHDERLHSRRARGAVCRYWPLATAHRQSAAAMRRLFPKLQALARGYRNHVEHCHFWNFVIDAV